MLVPIIFIILLAAAIILIIKMNKKPTTSSSSGGAGDSGGSTEIDAETDNNPWNITEDPNSLYNALVEYDLAPESTPEPSVVLAISAKKTTKKKSTKNTTKTKSSSDITKTKKKSTKK
jgi:hypothetical protein